MDHTEAIDQYLEGRMSEAERSAFERRLEEDPVLAKEFALQEKIYRALRDKEGLGFHQKLRAIRNQRTSQVRRTTRFPTSGFVLLLFALLTGGIIYWFRPNQNPGQMSPLQQQAPEIRQPVPDTSPATPPSQIRQSPQDASQPVATQPKQGGKATDDRKQATAVLSEKSYALVEKHYQNSLFPTVDRGLLRAHVKVYTQSDSIGLAFDHMDYSLVLQIAEHYPKNDRYYNTVVWTAANAAFLQHDCRRTFHYAGIISRLRYSDVKAKEAEMLLLLNYIKCGDTDDAHYRALIKKCAADRFHPAYELAHELTGF